MSAAIPGLLLALAWLLQSDRGSQKGLEPEEGIEAEETELPEDMVKKLVPPGEGKDSEEEEDVEAGEDFVLLDSVPAAYALFAVTENGNLQRWDVGQHSLQYSVRPLVDSVIGLCRSLDGKSLLYADRLSSIAVLDAVTGETTRKINWTQAQPIIRLAWDSEKQIVFGGTQRSLVRFNPDVPGEEFSVDLASNLGPVALDPLHGLLVAGIEDAMAVVGTEPFALIERLGGHESDVSALAFNGTAELLASGGTSGEVLVWQFEQRRVLKIARVPGAAIESLAFDLRTDLLAVGTARGDLIVLDARSGREFASLPTQTEESIDAVAFCDTGVLATADHEHGLRLWQLLRFIDRELMQDLVRRAKSVERPRDRSGEQPPSEAPQKQRGKEKGEMPPRGKESPGKKKLGSDG